MATIYNLPVVCKLASRGDCWSLKIVNTTGKHNKFYQCSGSAFRVTEIRYGRIGTDGRRVLGKDFNYMRDKVYDKIRKGYDYHPDTVTETPEPTPKAAPVAPSPIPKPVSTPVPVTAPIAVAPEPTRLTAAARELELQAELERQRAEERELAKTKDGRKTLLKRSMTRRKKNSDW